MDINTSFPSEETPGAYDSKGLTTDTNGANLRTEGAIQQVHDGNASANQLARLARAGHIVNKGSAGDFTVCKYGKTRCCKETAELQVFALQQGVVNHG